MAYGKLTKVKMAKKNPTFRRNILAGLILRLTQRLIYERKNEIHPLLLFSRVAGPAGRRDHGCCMHIEDLHIVHMTKLYNLTLILMYAI